MKLLKERILRDGVFRPQGILKVDSFLNHQMDIDLINEIGREFARRFEGTKVTKILTIEASGIGIACIAAQYFHVPVVFAKKVKSKNLDGDVYTANVHSYTKGTDYIIRVSQRFIEKNDHVLLIDDFLANGRALLGLIEITRKLVQKWLVQGFASKRASRKAERLSATWGSICNPLPLYSRMKTEICILTSNKPVIVKLPKNTGLSF